MASDGYFDFESQTWVPHGEAPPSPPASTAASAARRKRGASELFLLVGGILSVALGLLLLVIVATGASSGYETRAGLAAVGSWLLSIGVVLLFALLVINAFIDVWQRRMREPE